jgi:hypothetical protein
MVVLIFLFVPFMCSIIGLIVAVKTQQELDVVVTMFVLCLMFFAIFGIVTCVYAAGAAQIHYYNKRYGLEYTAEDYFFNNAEINEETRRLSDETD